METFKQDYECTLSRSDMNEIYNGWFSDDEKIQSLADSDGTTPEEVRKNIIGGMIGECGSHHWVSQHYECEPPEFGIIERDEEIWAKDLISLEDILIETVSGTTKTVLRSISCKSQFYSLTSGIGDIEPSWLFQLEGSGRFADPMLLDPTCNKLLIVSWVDDRWDEGNVNRINPRKAYKRGFRWKPKMVCFWWPEVFPYISEPRMKHLHGKKKALYYSDIKHLRSRLKP